MKKQMAKAYLCGQVSFMYFLYFRLETYLMENAL
jgi:hypothetical protein